jgi:hypothetical protein
MNVCFYNCCSGAPVLVDKFPFIIGSDADVDCRLDSSMISGKHCQVMQRGAQPVLVSMVPNGFSIDGHMLSEVAMEAGQDYPVVIGSQCFYLRQDADVHQWGESMAQGGWVAFQGRQAVNPSPMSLRSLMGQFNGEEVDVITMLRSQYTALGFPLPVMRLSMEAHEAGAKASASGKTQAVPPPPGLESRTENVDRNKGQFTCPHCWWNFDDEDVFWVAVHPALQGDPHLGESEYLRFPANRFAGKQALDPRGQRCSDIACPHCHLVVPRSMLRNPQQIISLVGDQSSGKSYYLSVLTKVLADSMSQYFHSIFEDETPAANAALRGMVNSLFGATDATQVDIKKTALDGEMYRNIRRKGEDRTISMPKPFIFSASNRDQSSKLNLVFYDNAGEHFQPSNNSVDRPGAQHVAKAGGILFLFDPFNHIDFKRAILRHKNNDPQFDHSVIDNVSVILSEMKNRIQKLTGSPKLKAPMAFIVGKYDAWHKLVPDGRKFYETRADNHLIKKSIEDNSELTKEILSGICPGIVALAESLSENTRFFPVSTFGVPPVKIPQSVGPPKLVPDPLQIQPRFVDTPVLWLMSQMDPNLVPIR